jgi:hypothetical protein
MKRIYAGILVCCTLGLLGTASGRAALVYVDAIDGDYHSLSASPNTFNAATDSASDWVGLSDGDPLWRFRNTGPGGVSYGASAYHGRYLDGDATLYTKVTGLTPGASYSGLRIYFAISAANNNWKIQYSLNGTTWSSSISRDTGDVVRLVPSTTDAFGTPTATSSGDTRCYFPIPGSLVADGSGTIKLFIRSPSDTTDRTVYDGFTYDSGVVPPPAQATAPQPAHGGKVFGTNSITTLSWSNPPPVGTLTCNVYFGSQAVYNPSNANHFGLPLVQSSVAGQSIPMPALTVGTRYYWMIDGVDSVAGLRAGALWSFDVVSPSAATGVIISEFMAANNRTLTNSLGETGDWIELYNNSASVVNLAGWHLTDAANNLTKWTFPSVNMPPDSYLLVWADDANTVTNGEIHTSFKLSADGEYLALVRPGGTIIEHEYKPVFPPQDDNISYGVDLLFNGADATIISSQTAGKYLVPTSDIGTTWRNRIFTDTTWSNGVTGLGFETSGSSYEGNINTDVETAMFNQMASIYLRVPFVVEDPGLFAGLKLGMYFEDGFVAYVNGVEVARSNAPPSLTWNASATATRPEAAAVAVATFQITNLLSSLLVSGTNVLAIHGLNNGAASTKFLLQPTLEATLENGVTVEQLRYYSVPTPGGPNSNAFLGFVADTKFSVDRGFYSSPFTVAITCPTAGVAIRYTTNGSTPSEVNGTLYTGPIPINTTTTLRAVAYRTGWRSSDVDTQTYIFVNHVLNQPAAPPGWPTTWANNLAESANYADYEMDPEVIGAPNNLASAVRSALTNIPTLSLVTDLKHLFDPTNGIYARPREEGVLWERPVSAEMIYPDGRESFQINCGLRIQGAGSRGPNSTPKHSMRLFFKTVYGASKLNHKLFPDTEVDSFDSIHLRAIYNNSWTKAESDQRNRAQENHDQFARDLQLAMGQETDHGTICHLYINGLYWGLYHPGERPDDAWAAEHFGGQKEDWDVLNYGQVVTGDRTAWDTMWTHANSGLSSLATYNDFRQYCDVENLADYALINHYIGNIDWDNRNWYAVRRREPGAGYKFVCWDSERCLENLADQKITGSQNNPTGPAQLFLRATNSAEFRLLVADRLHKYYFNGGVLTPTSVTNIWRKRSTVIDTVIAAESARWGDFRRDVLPSEPNVIYTPNANYFPQQNFLLNTYFPSRSANVFNQYVALGLYPSLAAPEFNQHGGPFTSSRNITITGPAAIYYTLDGSDPRQSGTGAIVGIPYSGIITLDHSTRVKARCHDGSQWSALLEADFFDVAPSPLRVTEVMYAPRSPVGTELAASTNASAFSFVEIHNPSAETVGFVGVNLAGGIQFDCSKGTNLLLAAGDYAVLVENPGAFMARYPGVPATKILGEYRGDLAENGDSIALTVQGLSNVVSFEYTEGRGWPLAADGAGHSLIPLIITNQSTSQLSYGGNWKASVNVNGSPAAPEPTPAFCLVLNEIAAHTDYDHPSYPEYDSNDWIELMNCGGGTLSLNGFYLSDDPGNLKKWAIPSGINLAAGQRIVFDEVTGFHAPITNGFGIDKLGEQILLSYAVGNGQASVVDAVEFKGQENGRTLGRFPDASGDWVVCTPTPGNNNLRAAPEPVLSEIMYHPAELIPGLDNTEHEFIELYNPTASAVNLWTLDHGTNIGSWRITGQVEYRFPATTTLAANGRVLIVPFHPGTNLTAKAAFVAHYGLSVSEIMFGPFAGKLSNQGGRVALEKPIAPDLPTESAGWVIVDEVYYFDDSPWMNSADGFGQSLHRVLINGAGRNPASWTAGDTSPGTGVTTHPDMILTISQSGSQLKLGFTLLPGYNYVVETKTNSLANPWTPYANVTYPTVEYTLNQPATANPAYFRLRRNP